jgi:hypothetical protein
MSVRPHLYGFDLGRFRRLFGSGDRVALEACSARLDGVAEDLAHEEPEEAEEYREEARAILLRAVEEGVPFPDLEVEGTAYMDVASALASYQQPLFAAGSSGWKMQAFRRFERDYGERLGADAWKTLGFLSWGRPLFGRRAEADGHYAFLDAGELDQLLGALRRLQQRCPELTGRGYLDGFVDALIGWLEGVAGRGQDIWLLAY